MKLYIVKYAMKDMDGIYTVNSENGIMIYPSRKAAQDQADFMNDGDSFIRYAWVDRFI